MIELESLLAEIDLVKKSDLNYLPQYGYMSKEEVESMLQDEIDELREELCEYENAYTNEELEMERDWLCSSQAISRYI